MTTQFLSKFPATNPIVKSKLRHDNRNKSKQCYTYKKKAQQEPQFFEKEGIYLENENKIWERDRIHLQESYAIQTERKETFKCSSNVNKESETNDSKRILSPQTDETFQEYTNRIWEFRRSDNEEVLETKPLEEDLNIQANLNNWNDKSKLKTRSGRVVKKPSKLNL